MAKQEEKKAEGPKTVKARCIQSAAGQNFSYRLNQEYEVAEKVLKEMKGILEKV